LLSKKSIKFLKTPFKEFKILRRIIVYTFIIALFAIPREAKSATPNYNYVAAAKKKFAQKKYDEAIKYYREHLKKSPRDYSAWNQIGASYYLTGLPRRGLKYLKFVERKTLEKSYNYYYQGLSYTAIDRPKKAKEYFAYAATRYTDEYGSRSTFEMGSIEYNLKKKDPARYWLSMYIQRYPTGVYRLQAQKMLASLVSGVWLKDIEGIAKPDMEKALFKYNKLSLSKDPHYWFVQAGSEWLQKSGKEPDSFGNVTSNKVEQYAGIANAGVGVGPVKQGNFTSFGGYTYKQNWYTNEDRLNTYYSDFTDIQYFPFRGDLLERTHQFYGDVRSTIADLIYWGVYAKLDFARIGSEIYPTPDSENQELNKVLKISDTSLIIPWIGFTPYLNHRSLFYLYLRKEINEDSIEHSNKSYDFGLEGSDPVISFGLSHTVEVPEYDAKVTGEFFQYEFIYNDYWLDYTRQGFMVSGEHEVVPRWYISGLAGMYTDVYLLPRLKNQSCSNVADLKKQGSGQTTGNGLKIPVSCDRTDNGTLIQAEVFWNWTQFTRISAKIQVVQNENSALKEFEESRQSIEFRYTTAFPSVTRVTRFVERFADSAFTKEPE